MDVKIIDYSIDDSKKCVVRMTNFSKKKIFEFFILRILKKRKKTQKKIEFSQIQSQMFNNLQILRCT